MHRTFEQEQERLWRLDRNYKVLANQRQVMESLSLAMQIGYGSAEWYDSADGLLKLVACEVYVTCEQIAADTDFRSLKAVAS